MTDRTMNYHDARTAALFREMEADPDVFLVGGVVTLPGVNPETPVEANFPGRVVWTPIAEFSAMSIGVGAAIAGLRPFVPIGTASFMFYGWPAVVLEAPNVRYATGGRVTAPVVFHVLTGLRRGSGVDHEHTPQAMLQQVPGLRVYAPGTPAEIDGVLHAALTGEDPVVVADHKTLFGVDGPVPDEPLDPDVPYLLREGGDALIVAHSFMLQHAQAAAELLAGEGIEVAVLSTPLINPAPVDAILDTVRRYDKVVWIDESRGPGSVASYQMARAMEAGLTPSTRLVCTADAPSPASRRLADEIVPTGEKVTTALRDLLQS